MWRVEGTLRVGKELARFDRKTQEQYGRAFERLANDPLSGEVLSGYRGLQSYPVTTPGGEHRIIHELKPEEQVVYVVMVGSRESIYRLLRRSGLGQ